MAWQPEFGMELKSLKNFEGDHSRIIPVKFDKIPSSALRDVVLRQTTDRRMNKE